MSNTMSNTSETITGQGTNTGQSVQENARVGALIGDLTSGNLRARRQAREVLAKMGPRAIAPLLAALDSSNRQLRWEAAKTLVELKSPETIPVLIRALEDENCDIRWLAAEGLVAHGQAVVVPLLGALEHRSESIYLRQGAHHILSELASNGFAPILWPVVAALEDVEPVLEVPVAAFRALDNLESRQNELARSG